MKNTDPQKLADVLWNKIVSNFREACFIAQDGNKEAAEKILKKDLPKILKQWKQISGLSQEEAQKELKHMFFIQRQQVNNTFLLRKALAEEAESFGDKQAAQGIRPHRIHADDISSIIDQIQFQENAAKSKKLSYKG